MNKNKTWTLWKDNHVKEEEARLLRRRADDVTFPLDDSSKHDIQSLIDNFQNRDDALGLAAPQIGISKRIIIFKNKNFGEKTRVKNKDDYDLLINPRITQNMGETDKMAEGCLSCPDVSVEVSRPTEVKVRAQDINGKKINKRYKGFIARIVQHEIDHLEGKLIIDHEGTIYVPKEKSEFFNRYFENK